ncbi:hypothetical protein PMAYCL1PPCAC_15265 [Pristionchus mayeri]|uniref:Uncharacterized protein n=1 Tax=Pristionchus mayeri TaxID=1317129 RepID=A0AAN5CIP2_9BILA|nr:hypothetical protein PMAYCL1PPCAC_15265 [Pristionchus mayeri]
MESSLLRMLSLLQIISTSMQSYVGSLQLRCGGGFLTNADVQPPIRQSSGVLVDWNLFSNDEFCSDPPNMPQFKNLYLSEVSLITTCPNCPQCSVVLPQQYELPITTTLQRIFLVTKSLPYNRPRTDIRVHYVLVDRLPTSIKNCELEVNGRSNMSPELNHPPMDWSNLLLVFVVLFAVVICTCGLRCACGKLFAERSCDNRYCKHSTASLSSARLSISHPKFSTHLDHAYTPGTLTRQKPAVHQKQRASSHEPFEARI